MEALQKEQVVGDVLESMPAQLLTVNWPGVSAQGGNFVAPTQIKDKPTLNFTADDNSFYTLIMADPDAPSRQNPKNGEWLHWLVVNIPGDSIAEGVTKSDYVGAGPPKGTGLHRYVFMIFKQKAKQVFDVPNVPNTSAEHRAHFKTKTFVKKHDLEIVAANFVQAEWDEYVPILYKQLGF